MTRRRINDRPLLAARLRPFRRPPRTSAESGSAPVLRLNNGQRTRSLPTHPVVKSLKVAEEIADSLHLALEAFARMIGEVSELGDIARRCTSARIAPSDSDILIADVARAIDGIELAATCEDADGKPFFDGTWHADLLGGDGRFSSRVDLPRVTIDQLGSDGIGGRLSSLLPRGGECLLLERPAIGAAIIRSAALWLAAERERVFRILAEVIEPLVAELEVIEANTTAAQMAGDPVVASDLAQVNKLHALANAKPLGAATQGDEAQSSSLRLRRHDDE